MDPAYYWIVQPAITAVAVVVALAAIWWNRRVARLKATLDLIEATESKEYYQVRYRAYRAFRKGGDPQLRILDPKDDLHAQEERDKCLDFLNHNEVVAIACRAGIIDAAFYRSWMGPTYVRDWNCAADLVRVARSPRKPGDPGNLLAYCEFERRGEMGRDKASMKSLSACPPWFGLHQALRIKYTLTALLLFSPAASGADLSVFGTVQTPLELRIADLKALPAKTVEVTFHTMHGDDHHSWTGALLLDVIGKAGLKNDNAKSAALRHVIFVHAKDGYETALAYGEIDPDAEGKQVLLAYQRGTEALPALRLIVPGDQGGPRQVHDVTSIELR